MLRSKGVYSKVVFPLWLHVAVRSERVDEIISAVNAIARYRSLSIATQGNAQQ